MNISPTNLPSASKIVVAGHLPTRQGAPCGLGWRFFISSLASALASALWKTLALHINPQTMRFEGEGFSRVVRPEPKPKK